VSTSDLEEASAQNRKLDIEIEVRAQPDHEIDEFLDSGLQSKSQDGEKNNKYLDDLYKEFNHV